MTINVVIRSALKTMTTVQPEGHRVLLDSVVEEVNNVAGSKNLPGRRWYRP